MTWTPIRRLLLVAAGATLVTGLSACLNDSESPPDATIDEAGAAAEALPPSAEWPKTDPRVPKPHPQVPNILFILTDDVGIDQFRAFGYGGPALLNPAMPNIDEIANEGVRFRNLWSMPACSVSRSVFFTGRFPLRTDLYGALGPADLANSMDSPWETTVPKLLKARGYESALFGKFHLGLQGNSPFNLAMPHSLGWDYLLRLARRDRRSLIDRYDGRRRRAGRYLRLRLRPGGRPAWRRRRRRLLRGRRDLHSDDGIAGRCQPARPPVPGRGWHLRSREDVLPVAARLRISTST